MKTALRTHVAAAMLLLPVAAAFVAQPAMAQQRAVVAQNDIFAMSLNSSDGLLPGATLWANVRATPGASSGYVSLGESGVRVTVRETSPGTYVGHHVIRPGERINPMQLLMARIDYRGGTASRNFTYPSDFRALVAGAPRGTRPLPPPPPQAVAPVIERFAVQPSGRLLPGAQLNFRLAGTPRANASVEIPGVVRGVELRETQRGIYEGSYTVRRADDLRAFERAVATFGRGNLATTAQLDLRRALEAAAPAQPVPPVVAAPVIERFAVLPGARLSPGSQLSFRLTGTPRSTATVEIPGVVSGLVLRETTRGVYEGSYTVRRADDRRAFDNAVATFSRANLATKATLDLRGAVQAEREDRREERREGRDERRDGRDGKDRDDRQQAGRDQQPPQVTAVSPANDEVVEERRRTRITARLADAGSGIDPASVRLTVDGLDVTKNTEVTGDLVRYREELGSGRHSAQLVVRDKAGNTTRTAWSFQVR